MRRAAKLILDDKVFKLRVRSFMGKIMYGIHIDNEEENQIVSMYYRKNIEKVVSFINHNTYKLLFLIQFEDDSIGAAVYRRKKRKSNNIETEIENADDNYNSTVQVKKLYLDNDTIYASDTLICSSELFVCGSNYSDPNIKRMLEYNNIEKPDLNGKYKKIKRILTKDNIYTFF